VSELRSLEPDKRNKDHTVIQVSERVPGERVRLVVSGRRTDDGSACTLLVIHEDSGTWAIHGLGNQGVRMSAADMVALTETIVERVR
jgi:Zn-dependent alcohol dehydrogenase